MVRFRTVPFAPKYGVSVSGEVMGCRGKILRPYADPKCGHMAYTFYLDSERFIRRGVHQAVMAAWGPPKPSDKHQIRHLDGDAGNNHLDNLAWGTQSENEIDKRRHGTGPRGERKSNAKLTAAQVNEILDLGRGFTGKEWSRRYGVTYSAIDKILKGENWTHIHMTRHKRLSVAAFQPTETERSNKGDSND